MYKIFSEFNLENRTAIYFSYLTLLEKNFSSYFYLIFINFF